MNKSNIHHLTRQELIIMFDFFHSIFQLNRKCETQINRQFFFYDKFKKKKSHGNFGHSTN